MMITMRTKIFKLVLCITLLGLQVFAEYPTKGTVIASPILPNGSFPVFNANHAYGGWHVSTNAASIPSYLLAEGTAVYNPDDNSVQIWDGDSFIDLVLSTTNGSSTNAVAGSNVVYSVVNTNLTARIELVYTNGAIWATIVTE